MQIVVTKDDAKYVRDVKRSIRDYVRGFSIAYDDSQYAKYIRMLRLKSHELTLIILYTKYGSTQKLGSAFGVSRECVRKEVARIVRKCQTSKK